jgi:hypothetical protein
MTLRVTIPRGQWTCRTRRACSAKTTLHFHTATANNDRMDTTNAKGVPADILADVQAVLDQFALGKPLDPEAARRVREHSRRVSEETRQRLGVLNVAAELIREVRNGE